MRPIKLWPVASPGDLATMHEDHREAIWRIPEWSPGVSLVVVLADGERWIALEEMLYGACDVKRGLVAFPSQIEDRWTYRTGGEALQVLLSWDGDGDAPVGWIRHRPSNRRRWPDGDPTTEEVRA